jgi:hypothetical protein
MTHYEFGSRCVAAAVFAALLTPAASQGEPCGTVVAAGTTLTLTGNVGPCTGASEDTAIVVESEAILDLGGFYVACSNIDDDNAMAGIRVDGTHAEVRNGWIYYCNDGIAVSGDGRHRIEDVTLNGNASGVHVEAGSERNAIVSVTTYGDEGSTAFLIEGDKTVLEECLAWEAGTGFLLSSNRNRINDSFVRESLYGFDLAGERNRVNRSAAVLNDVGIRCRGEGSTIREATVSNNVGDGLAISASARVKSSSFSGNDVGVHVTNGDVVRVSGNISSFNTTFDMADETLDCGLHRWFDNVFEESNQTCIE